MACNVEVEGLHDALVNQHKLAARRGEQEDMAQLSPLSLKRLKLDVYSHASVELVEQLLQGPALSRLEDLDLQGEFLEPQDLVDRLGALFEARGQACGLRRLRLHLSQYRLARVDMDDFIYGLSDGRWAPDSVAHLET
jgi:hypothetical protein